MSKLTEREYEEYIRLLKMWVEAEKGLEGAEDEVDPEARERVRAAHAAVQGYRQQHGLGGEERGAEAQPMAEDTKQVYAYKKSSHTNP